MWPGIYVDDNDDNNNNKKQFDILKLNYKSMAFVTSHAIVHHIVDSNLNSIVDTNSAMNYQLFQNHTVPGS